MPTETQKAGQTVWITGASSGLGLHTAQALRKAGFRVIAGARAFESPERRADENCLPLDVTKQESIDVFVEKALQLAGPPDILINCAGVLVLGPCEGYALDELRQVMETNFFGQAAMIARALPLMRTRGRGRIVNFSSINGLLGVPFQGAYTASKHAVEGYSECLAMECAPFGVEVMLVEPGDHQSGSAAYRRHARAMDGAPSPYAAAFARGCAVIAHDERCGSDPDRLGEKIARTLKKRRLPRRLRIAKGDQRLAVVLHDALPGRLFGKILASYYGKNTHEKEGKK